MGLTSEYKHVKDWECKPSGYQTGEMVRYDGNIFVADFWAQAEPGKKPKPAEGWALYDELYDVTSHSPTENSKIIAYLPTWRVAEKFPYGKPSIYKNVTHVIISFIMFNLSALGQLNPKSVSDVKAILPDVMQAAKSQGVSIMIALGGATDYAFLDLMTRIGNNPMNPLLDEAARVVAKFVLDNNLDGIDLDLECWWDANGDSSKDQGGRARTSGPHPAGRGLTLFAKRIRELMPGKLISAALPGTSWYGNNFDPNLQDYVDWLGLMTYDLTGSWNQSPVGPHSALYKIRDQSKYQSEQQGDWPGGGPTNNPIASIEEAIWYWTNPYYSNWQGEGAKIARSKVAIGLPLYGYDFAHSKTPDDLSGQIPPGYEAIRYKDIIKRFPNAVNLSDGNIKVKGSSPRPSFINAPGSYGYLNNIYFESPITALEKQSFAKRVGTQGLIVWEMTNDAEGEDSILGRIYPQSGNQKFW